MAICIYAQDCTDFSTNGLGLLTPSECYAYAEDGHFTELELTQPIDSTYRWAQLKRDRIIKAPVPARESPFYERVEDITEGQNVTVNRKVYKVRAGRLSLFSGPGASYKALESYPYGTEVFKLDEKNYWFQVTVGSGGKTGWMPGGYLTYVREGTEVISQAKVIGHRMVSYRQAQDQLWRIFSVEPDTAKGVVVAKAQHIFYDLQYNIVGEEYKPENETAKKMLTDLWAKLMYTPEHTLRIAAGLEDKIEGGDYSFKNPVECMLETDSGILNQAGARLVLDNYDVWALPKLKRDNGVTIRRGKNLKGVQVTDDGGDVVTRIIPCGKTKDGDPLFITDGTGPKHDGVDSSRIGSFPFPRVKKIDYDVKIVDKDPDNEKTFRKEADARAKLKELARDDFEKNGVDRASYGMKVDFALLENSAEYAEYAGLQAVFLGDTVTVIDSMIDLAAQVEAVGFKFNCLTKQYDSLTLGDVDELAQKIYSYQLPKGGISGTKIAEGSADGSILRSMSLEYAKISTAAIERLSADSISALTAYIDNLTAETITTNELSAAYAHIYQLIVEQVTAETIRTGEIHADTLFAAMAQMVSVSARWGDFDFATVQHLVANALNIQEAAVAGRVFIENLSVAYAQMVDATIRNLVVRSSDGGYYQLDVGANGSVTAVPVTVTEDEAQIGHTQSGQPILETDITATNLNTANLLATYALVNKIDAARIDVAELFAQKAFIDHLNTTDISSNTTVTIVTRKAESAAAAAAAAQETADNAAAEMEAHIRQQGLWFTFDSDRGFIVQKKDEEGNPVSIWSTVTDEVGYHIHRQDLEDYVFSAYRDRCRVQKLEIGEIMVKPSSRGGHVWVKR